MPCLIAKPYVAEGSWEIPRGSIRGGGQLGGGGVVKLWIGLVCPVRMIRVLSKEEIVQFVQWDVHCNTALIVGDLILLQGDTCVPIGGHISAQLAELWALARELQFVFTEERSTLETTFK